VYVQFIYATQEFMTSLLWVCVCVCVVLYLANKVLLPLTWIG